MDRQTERNQSKTELQIYDASELHDLPVNRVWRFPASTSPTSSPPPEPA